MTWPVAFQIMQSNFKKSSIICVFFPKVLGPSIQRAVSAAPAMQPTVFASAGLLVDGRHRCIMVRRKIIAHTLENQTAHTCLSIAFCYDVSVCNTTSRYFGTSCAFSHRVPGFRLQFCQYVALRSGPIQELTWNLFGSSFVDLVLLLLAV